MAEWRGADYHRESSLQETLALENLAQLALTGNEQVLDVGCGDGKVTARIANKVPQGAVVGTDVSADMIAFATSRFGGDEHSNLRFMVADACRLPFEREFDLIVSFNALHWVRDQEAALRAIATALQPSGKAVLQFVSQGDHKSLEDVAEEVRTSPRWASYFAAFETPFVHFTPAEYQTLVERSGLRVLEQHVKEHRWPFGTREAFSNWCRATFVFWLTRLPEDQYQAFIDEVLDRYHVAAPPGFRDESTFTFYQLRVTLAAMP